MDWRKRNYYLVSFNYDSHHMMTWLLKSEIPTIKFSPPYNHVGNHAPGSADLYDGRWIETTGIIRPDYMISCPEEDSECLEYELRKMTRRENGKFYKLTKEFCKQ